MARWRLTDKHYIYTDPPTEWEQKETDLTSGEEVRKRYEVPKYLNPEEPRNQNYPGECIVCWKGKGEPKDIAFRGMPTPSMIPLDEEAEKISAQAQRGEHPIDSLPMTVDAPPDTLRQMQAQINALMMANDEMQRRLAAAEGDALADAQAIASQAVPIAKTETKPAQRRL